MTPDDLLRHTASRHAAATEACLSDVQIAEFADGSLDAGRRAALMSHVARCVRCRTAIASVARAISDPEVAASRPGVWNRRRIVQIAVPAAAAALIVLVTLPERVTDERSSHRAPTIAAVAEPQPMSPLGVVSSARTLRWAAVSGADRYRVTLFSASSDVLFETMSESPVVVLPDSIVLRPGRTYLWKVEARTGWGRWSSSELVEFSIR
jgi:hypothetical protein